ncbi:MAG TPA: deoxyuridine 5'-triphosphate nucleotidohydrolase [Candidatus Dormibacteraeota bacterium]|jgi:dUTP pyrophosphatase|nr:deoxyuridine 5'-triphosphate nucleotidohydrolase [Candidatus Dormibacteraeota bacterium]
MSTLSREELRRLIAASPALVEDISELDRQLQPNGIDLRIDRVFKLTSPALLGASDALREPAAREEIPPDRDGWWDLHQGSYVIVVKEKVNLPADVMALARPRSTLLRSGVTIHTAVWDAGYNGRSEALLAVLNGRGFRVQRGARVLQLVFMRMEQAPHKGYAGKYQGEGAE